MIYSARLFSQFPEEQRSRYGGRSLGGSLFQKPEVLVTESMDSFFSLAKIVDSVVRQPFLSQFDLLVRQVMNMMKAPSSQGGPNKLSDEQVELTQKWLSHNGIRSGTAVLRGTD
jgi:hypothetical protein